MKALQKNITGLLMAQKTAEDIFFFSYITVKKILSVKDCITYIHTQARTQKYIYSARNLWLTAPTGLKRVRGLIRT